MIHKFSEREREGEQTERGRKREDTQKEERTYSVQVCVGVLRHVIVKDNVDSLNVHASAKQIRGNQYPFTEALERLILGKPT